MSTTTTSRPLAGIPSTAPQPTTIVMSMPSQPSPTDSGSGYTSSGGSGGSGNVNSTLYLFTFLTTLLLLLAVSCGIVIRSFVLRRRFHRRVEEAIAAGVLLPGQTRDIAMGPGGSINMFRRPLGEKPKMWEVWINERAVGHHPTVASEWAMIQPIAVTRVSDTPSEPKVEPTTAAATTTAGPSPPASTFQRLASRLPFGRSRAPTSATPASPEVPLPTLGYGTSPTAGQAALDPTSPKPQKTEDLDDGTASVRVAVFIAMPDPSRPRYTPGSISTDGAKGKQRSSEIPTVSTDEHELPEICIGVAQAQLAKPTEQQQDTTPKP